MKANLIWVSLCLAFIAISVRGQVPGMISYQGMVTDNGAPFTGTGHFKCALVNAAGNMTYWSNDGTSTGGGEPSGYIEVPVENGVFNVFLGDSLLMNSIASSVFQNNNLHLRVWLRQDAVSFVRLTPDQPLGSVGYAMMAAQVANGAIGGSQLAANSVTDAKIVNNTITSNKIDWTTMPPIGGGTTLRGYAENGNFSPAPDASGGWNCIAMGVGAMAIGDFTTVGGGVSNSASSWFSTVGGGQGNVASFTGATVSGGRSNTARSSYATVGGGNRNMSSHQYATVGGGDQNNASNQYATISGGFRSTAIGEYATIGGGRGHNASGTDSTVSGGYYNEASQGWSTVGGGILNKALGYSSTVAGGQGNRATAHHATIAGGRFNETVAANTTIAGGYSNRVEASGISAVIGGGSNNTATGVGTVIAGGANNTARGMYSTVPGGFSNEASTNYAFAAGHRARAIHVGAFVWADSTDANFFSTRPNQFTVRASGGVDIRAQSSGLNPAACRIESTTANGVGLFITQTSSDANIVTANPGTGDHIKSFSGVGGGTLAFRVANNGHVTAQGYTSTSDRNRKDDFAPVDTGEILGKVVALPITTWRFKSDNASIRHIGPMAQDFHAAFKVGETDTGIATVDADGVALAAIQGLHRKVVELEMKNAGLKARLERLESLVLGAETEPRIHVEVNR